MSVIEADSSVLQPHTNGDISTAPVIHNEAHDTSNESRENVQLEEELNVRKAAEPVGKTTEINVETPNSFAPELDNIQAPVEAAIPSNSDDVLKVNGDTESHTLDVASPTFESTGIAAPSVTVKEQAADTPSIENVIPEPKELNSNQQLLPVEKQENPIETAKEKSADMVTASEVSTAALNVPPITAPEAAPTIEVLKEEVAATTTELEPKESTIAQSESTITASTNTASEFTSSLADPVPSSSVSGVPSPISAKLEPEQEVVSKAVVPDAIPADTETETLPIKTPPTSAAESITEVAPTGAVELGISASQRIEAKPAEEVKAEATPNTTETIPVVATTVELPANPPVMNVAEAANETPVTEDSAKAPAVEVAKPATAVAVPEVHETSPLVGPLVMTPPVEATVAPETVPVAVSETEAVKESIIESSTAVEQVASPAAEIVHESAVEPVTSAEFVPSEETTTVPAALSETEAVKESIVELSTAVEEVAPPAAEIVTESAAGPVTSAEVVPSEETTGPEPVAKESVPVEDPIVSSEPVPPVATAKAHVPSKPTSEDASGSVETSVSAPVEKVSAAPAGLPETNDQPTEVTSSTEPSAEIPSAPTAVQEATVAESAAADVDVHADAGVPTEVEEPVSVEEKAVAEEAIAEPIVPEVAEPVKEEVAVVTPPVEATIAPETEPVKESIVEPSTAIEEVSPPVAELVTQSATEPVTSVEDAPGEEATTPQPIVKEDSAPPVAELVTECAVEPVTIAEVVPSGETTTVPAAVSEIPAGVPTEVEELASVKEKAVAEEAVAEPIVPEVAEPAKEVAVVTPPAEALIAPETVPSAVPETEPVKESIVESSTAVEEVTPPVAELVTQSATEPVTSVEDAPGEEATTPQPIVKEESVSVDNAIVSSESAQPVATKVHAPSEAISEDASALTEVPVSVPVEKVFAAPAGLAEANDQPIEVASSTEPSAEIPSAPTTVQEITVAESAATDADVHADAGVPTEVEEPVSVKENAVAEEAVAEPIVPEVAEPAKGVAVVTPPVEATIGPETEPVKESIVESSTAVEEVALPVAELVTESVVEPVTSVEVVPSEETTTVPAAVSETEAVKESIVEPNTAVEEAAPSVAELVTKSAMESVTSVEDAPGEETTPQPIVKEESVSVDDAIVSSESAQPIATKVHAPSEAISEDASVLTEVPVSVSGKKVSIAPPAELPVANDQSIEVTSSTGPSAEIPSAPATVQEVAVADSVAADVDVHVPAEIPTKVEEPVTESIVSEVVEPAEEVVELVTTESVHSSASEVVPEEDSAVPALEVQDGAPTVSEHLEASIEPESVEASNKSSEVSQQASATLEFIAASEDTPETAPAPATQDNIASTSVIPVLEKPNIVAIAEAPANEIAPSEEQPAPPSVTAITEESVAKDVDIPSNVTLATDHPKSFIEQPTPPAEHAPVEKPASTPAINLEGPVAVQDNDDTTIVEAPSSKVVQEHLAVEETESTQKVDLVTSEGTQVVAAATSEESSTAETPAVVAEEESAEPKEVSTESTSASDEPIGTSVLEPVASSDGTIPHPSVPVVDQEPAGPEERADGIEQSGMVIDQELILSQEADAEQQEVVPTTEKTLITHAAVTTVDEPISDAGLAVPKDDRSVTEQIAIISTVEEAASIPVPEAPSAEEAVVVEQVQATPVEEAIRSPVETSVEAGIEEPVSTPDAEGLTRHEEIQGVEESIQTKQAEVMVETEDKVEPPKDVPVIESSTLEEATPAPIPNVVLVEKEIVAEQVVEEPAPAETVVKATVEEVDLTSAAETLVAKHEETPLVVEEGESLEVAKPQDQIESSRDATSTVEHTTTEGATSAEIVPAEPTDTTPPVTTIVTAEETSTEEPTLSQEEVEAVIATVPSVAEGQTEAVSESIVETSGQTNNEPKETVEEKIALHVGADLERPKSPWTPSFQVTTVGRGVSPDELLTDPGADDPVVDSFTETRTEAAKVEELPSVEKAPAPVPVTADVEGISKDVEQPPVSAPQLVIDKSTLVELAAVEESSEAPIQEPRPLTPSYSVHSQGSPRPDNVELEVDAQEPSARPWTPSYSVHSQGSPLPTQTNLVDGPTPHKERSFVDNEHEAVGLEEMKFADNENTPAIVSNAPLDQQAQTQEVPANASNKEQAAPAEVRPSLTTDLETKYPLEATVPSAQAAFDSVHTEVRDSSEAIATSLEQNNRTHVFQVEDDVNDSLVETAAPVTETEAPRPVFDVSKEVSAPSVSASEQISEGLAPHVEERPASPWVTSYSVIVQGSPAQERPNPLDKEAVATTEPGVIKSDVESEPPIVEAPTISAKNVAETESLVHETPSVEIAKAEVVTKTTEEPHEDSTIKETPAVQNTNNSQQDTVSLDSKLDEDTGSVAIDTVKTAVNMAVGPVSEVFPSTEQSVAEQPKKSKSSGLRLATSNENTITDGSSASPDTIPSATARSRLESTASSPFFPGAWFSPSKTVDESRPFFEVVQGEFTPKKLAAARDPSIDENPSIDEGPSVAEQSTETQGEANKEPQPASKEQKSRWCVIM